MAPRRQCLALFDNSLAVFPSAAHAQGRQGLGARPASNGFHSCDLRTGWLPAPNKYKGLEFASPGENKVREVES